MISSKKFILLGLFACLMTGFTPLRAQYAPDIYIVGEEARFSLLPDFVDDFNYLVTAPTRFDEQSFRTLVSLSAVTAGLMIGVDVPVHNVTTKHDRYSYNLMSAPGRLYDTVDPALFTYGGSAFLIGSGYLLKDRKLARTGWAVAEAVLFTSLATGVLKSTFGRERPYEMEGHMDFDPYDFDDGNSQRSLPSGHTSRIFAFSTVLASSYDTPWVRIPAYALAGSVALQRVESGDHWVSDVVVGGAIGYFIGRALAKQNGLVESRSRIYPVVRGGLVGLNVQF